MAHSKSNLDKRNAYIVKRYAELRKRNPKWSIFSCIQDVADEVWLSPVTVAKILGISYSNIPAPATISRAITLKIAFC